MNKRAHITSLQLVLAAAGSALMFPYTFMPILRVPPANQDAWVVFLLSIVYVFVINAPFIYLANKFRGLDICVMNELILGKVASKFTLMIIALFAIFCFIECMILTVMFVKMQLLAETPEWAIVLLILVPTVYAAKKGAGTIARLAFFIIPTIILLLIIFFIIGLKEMDIAQIQPILTDSTPWELNKGAFLTASRFSEVLIVVVFSYFLIKKTSLYGVYLKTIGVFSLGYLLMLVPVLLTVGSEVAKIANNPYTLFTRLIAGQFFRVQSINILGWFTGVIIKLTLYNFIASYMFSRVIKKKPQKFFVLPLAFIAFAVSFVPLLRKMSFLNLIKSDLIFPWIVFGVIFGMGMILLIFYLVRKKKIDKKIKEELQYEDDRENVLNEKQEQALKDKG